MSQSKIGEYGYRYVPIEEHKTKTGKRVPPQWRKIKFSWKEN